MKLSLSQAAKEAGKSKSRISEAIKDGSLTAIKNGNRFEIEPSELFRRFPKTELRNGPKPNKITVLERPPETEKDIRIKELEAKLEGLENLLAEKDERIQDFKDAQKLLSAPKSGLIERIFGRR